MIHRLRCRLCEALTSWALTVAPKDYTPSFIQAVVDAAAAPGVTPLERIDHVKRTSSARVEALREVIRRRKEMRG